MFLDHTVGWYLAGIVDEPCLFPIDAGSSSGARAIMDPNQFRFKANQNESGID